MKTNDYQHGRRAGSFGEKYAYMHQTAGNGPTTGSGIEWTLSALAWIVRRTAWVLGRIFTLLKFQFYKTTAVHPAYLKAPLLKLTGLVCLAYLFVNGNISLRLSSVDRQKASFLSGSTEFLAREHPTGQPSVAQGASFSGSAAVHKEEHFADRPTDSKEERKIKAYVRRFRKVAQTEHAKYGIPASIKLAQAILESNAGSSKLATKTNNHFGIKCFSKTCGKGHCANFGDDTHKDFFRRYETAWESWRSHSEFLVSGKYRSLIQHGDNYVAWAKGLKALGYATAAGYDDRLIALVEKYHLDELD
ncbi:MAG: hypothetical protein RLY31_1354 [Bacteroidota bacterium]|jgi:hypothetical protein